VIDLIFTVLLASYIDTLPAVQGSSGSPSSSAALALTHAHAVQKLLADVDANNAYAFARAGESALKSLDQRFVFFSFLNLVSHP
jgi:hypothetical protein